MQVPAAEGKLNFGKELDMRLTGDIRSPRNGKTAAKVINPNGSSVDSISGILAGPGSPQMDRHA